MDNMQETHLTTGFPSSPPYRMGSQPRGPTISFLSESLHDPLLTNNDSDPGVSEVDELETRHDTFPVSTNGSIIPNPWIDNPNPRSEIYPGITYQLKSFTNSTKTMRASWEIWPYRPYPADEKKVLFFEFRGYGPPPADVGNPGDFYLDLTHEGSLRYLMYIRERREWVCNNWSADPNRKEFRLPEHPLLKDRYLWGTSTSGLTWFTGDTLRKLGCYRIRDKHDPEPMIKEALTYSFDGSKLADSAKEKDREVAETERRAKLRSIWEINNNISTPQDLERQEAEREKRRRYEADSQRKLEERIQRRRSVMGSQRSDKGGTPIATEQESTPMYSAISVSSDSDVNPRDLDNLPIPTKRHRGRSTRVTLDNSNGAIKIRKTNKVGIEPSVLSDDSYDFPEAKRQRLDMQQRASSVMSSGFLSQVLSSATDSELRDRTQTEGPDATNRVRGDGGGEGRTIYKEEEEGDNNADDEGDGEGDCTSGRRKSTEYEGIQDEGDRETYKDGFKEEGLNGRLENDMAEGEIWGVSSNGGAPGELGDQCKIVDSSAAETMRQDADRTGPHVQVVAGDSTTEDVVALTEQCTEPTGRHEHSHSSGFTDVDESTPSENAESIIQKAADVHTFLLKGYSSIEKERNALKVDVRLLSNALQKEKNARIGAEERISHLNTILVAEKHKRSTAAAELEEVKQRMEKVVAHEAELMKALQDMMIQRDKAIAKQHKNDRAHATAMGKLAKAKDLFLEVQQSLGENHH